VIDHIDLDVILAVIADMRALLMNGQQRVDPVYISSALAWGR
jgi:hypothetical protein